MPPNSSNLMAVRDRMLAGAARDGSRILMMGISRASVKCRRCRTRLACDARIIRDHLQLCVSPNLVMVANSEEFVRNRSLATAAAAVTATTTSTSTGSSGTVNNTPGSEIGSGIVAAAASAAGGGRTTTTVTTTTSTMASTASTASAVSAAGIYVQKPAKELLEPLQLPQRILTGPGPSNCSQRVLRALHHQVLGHMHPEIFKLMDEIKAGLCYAFQTANELTLAISASGHGGMEAAIVNLLEKGDKLLVVKAGLWGERAADMAARLGIHVDFLETELGVAFTPDELEEAVKRHKPQAVFVVHSESSTGLKQPLHGLANVVHKYGALLIVDTVASLGAEPFFMDAWGIDVVYTGSQKVLGAPAGITPISFSRMAENKIFARTTPITSYYLDMTLLGRYWNCFGADNGPRIYHHTISATLVYGLREALAQLAEEGLPACWARHAAVTDKFHEGLRKRGYGFFVKEPKHRLPTVTGILLPSGVDASLVIRYAMERYNVEISGGLGPTAGKIVRIGLMGVNATSGHVDLVLRALDEGTRYAKSQIKSNL